jgi:uncharacterized membrane protein
MLAIFLKPTKVDTYRKYWNIYHHVVGYILLSLVLINIFKGFTILQPPKCWKLIYITLLVLLAFVALLLEITTWVIFYQTKKSNSKSNQSPSPAAPPRSNGVASNDVGSSAPPEK